MCFFFSFLALTKLSRWQYGYLQNLGPLETPVNPSILENPCKSRVCKDRLNFAYGELRKASHSIRSLSTTIEEERISAARHILHLKKLKDYQVEKKKDDLIMSDVNNLYDGLDIEDREEVEETAQDTSVGSFQDSSVGTTQSLSWFSDSDSDYIP